MCSNYFPFWCEVGVRVCVLGFLYSCYEATSHKSPEWSSLSGAGWGRWGSVLEGRGASWSKINRLEVQTCLVLSPGNVLLTCLTLNRGTTDAGCLLFACDCVSVGWRLRLLPTRLSVSVSEGDDCQIKSLSLVSIDHNLPSGLNYNASHPPLLPSPPVWRTALAVSLIMYSEL